MPPSRVKRKPTAAKNRSAGDSGLRTRLLLAALPDVAFDGWHDDLLTAAAIRAGVTVEKAEEVFPAGTRGLALYLNEWADEETRLRLTREDTHAPRVRDRVARGVEIRLDVLTPWKQAVSRALCYLGTPPGGFLLPAHVWRTADMIWDMAGDTATDYNRYTKRLLLSGVLTATTLYWLGDTSPDHTDTRAFLARRIDDALKIGKAAGKARGAAKGIRDLLRKREKGGQGA